MYHRIYLNVPLLIHFLGAPRLGFFCSAYFMNSGALNILAYRASCSVRLHPFQNALSLKKWLSEHRAVTAMCADLTSVLIPLTFQELMCEQFAKLL